MLPRSLSGKSSKPRTPTVKGRGGGGGAHAQACSAAAWLVGRGCSVQGLQRASPGSSPESLRTDSSVAREQLVVANFQVLCRPPPPRGDKVQHLSVFLGLTEKNHFLSDCCEGTADGGRPIPSQ